MDANLIGVISTIAVVSIMSIAASVIGWSMSKAIIGALENMARQPEARGAITTAMIIGLALMEALVIYCLVVSLVLMFVNPFKG